MAALVLTVLDSYGHWMCPGISLVPRATVSFILAILSLSKSRLKIKRLLAGVDLKKLTRPNCPFQWSITTAQIILLYHSKFSGGMHSHCHLLLLPMLLLFYTTLIFVYMFGSIGQLYLWGPSYTTHTHLHHSHTTNTSSCVIILQGCNVEWSISTT